MTDRDVLFRPSTWVAALAAALFVPGVMILGDIGRGAMRADAWYFWVGVTSFAAVLGLVHGGMGLLWAALLVAERWPRATEPAYAPEPAPVPTPPAAVARPVVYNVGGERRTLILTDDRSERWQAWQDATWRVVDWYEQTRSLSANALVPAAISDRTAWVRLTDELARAGLVLKDQTGTRWRHPLGAIRARLSGGALDWPDTDPPRIAPCPAAARIAVVDAERPER